MSNRFPLIISLILLSILGYPNAVKVFSTEKKVVEALRIEDHIKIDGILDEAAWNSAIIATGFTQYEPFNGAVASEQAEVKILFDNTAIYIGAMLYDSKPDMIFRELGQRDNSDNLKSDVFTILMNPYNDGINFQEFTVSASGVQTDIRHTGDDSDRSWNAVWDSKVSFTEWGWVVEMRIPYSALRFSNRTENNWGINFLRLIKRYNEWSSWNPIDKSISGKVNQSGELSGIRNVDSPVRLSFSPYISSYVEKHPDSESLSYRFNGGMDLKVGISDGFTLDMTLIPDFGQVKSDDKILNISPYEVMYEEQRSFFTEGMDLFRKGDIFYTRRIGSQPKGYDDVYSLLNDNEKVVENPAETSMINGTKVSGRTGKGLGIGLFNALTSREVALIRDTLTGLEREVTTQGLANYNMVVLDQTLRNNSYVSFANTNFVHPHASYTGNVTATDFIVKDKKNMYELQGIGAVSQISNDSLTLGYRALVTASKTSGNFLFDVYSNTESENYNPNDMGYLQKANEFSNGVELGYKIYKPFWKLLNLDSEVGYEHTQLYSPRLYSRSSVYFDAHTTFAKRYFSTGINFSFNPTETHDFDESRTAGRMLIIPRNISGSFWTSSDYRKPIAIDTQIGYWKGEFYDYVGGYVSISPRLRFSDNFMLIYVIMQEYEDNSFGFAGKTDDEIFIGLREISTLTNTLNGLYTFNATSFLNLRVRHYWRWVDYTSYRLLYLDGSLSNPLVDHNLDKNINYNLFNIDLTYKWHFAPGSELAVVWKNTIELSNKEVRSSFGSNFSDVFKSDQVNSLSLRILYYIDYIDLRRGLRK